MTRKIQAAEDSLEEDLKGLLATRQALAEKLRLLERRVEEKVVGPKYVALDLIDQMKNMASDLLETPIRRISPSVRVPRKSLMTVGMSVAIGLLAGWITQRRRSGTLAADYLPRSNGASPVSAQADPRIDFPHEQAGNGALVPSLWDNIVGELGQEGARLQKAALMTGRSFLHDLVRIAVQSLINAFDRRVLLPPSKRIEQRDSSGQT
jgi:hypothetical protein